MAKYVERLINLEHKIRRHFKRALDSLDDSYTIRSPLLERNKIAQIILKGAENSWLFISYHPISPEEDELVAYLNLVSALAQKNFKIINYLVVTEEKVSSNDLFQRSIVGVKKVNSAHFFADTALIIQKYSVNVGNEQVEWLKKNLLTESAIHSACTTRIASKIDCSAQLQYAFLDYDQELASKFDLIDDGQNHASDIDFSVRLINGVAGSGKTLILIKRALLYCEMYPDRHTLLLIHNRPITNDIQDKFARYLGGKPRNLHVRTFHAYARALKFGFTEAKPNICFDIKSQKYKLHELFSQEKKCVDSLNLSENQLFSELEYINDYRIANEQEYLTMERQGRGFALQHSQRVNIWKLYEQVMAKLNTGNNYLAGHYIREMLLEGTLENAKKYEHILLDEAQFFAPAWLDLVKLTLAKNGQLFMCADPNQGFLKSRLSWKSVGLNVRGRTKKFTRSYRTTLSILKAANALVESLGEEDEDFLKPDFDRMDVGSKPHVILCDSPQNELFRFLNELQSCISEAKVPLNQILVLFSYPYNLKELKQHIEKRVGQDTVNDYKKEYYHLEPNKDYIKLASINSCTGLEAGVTFVIGVGGLLSQYKSLDYSPEESFSIKQDVYRKLYVAMTRAGQKLLMFSTDSIPEEIEPYVEVESS